jgi:hypothetical protein
MEAKIPRSPLTQADLSINFEDIKLFNSVLKMPLAKLPVTSSLISLSTGNILLSPHPSLTPAEFQSMSKVTDIVAPNLYHHLGIQKAIKALPGAHLWGVGGFEQKRKDISWQSFLTASTWPYQEELAAIQIAGMPKLNEFVFVHKKSKTLFLTDLCFNILEDSGLPGWLLYNVFGTYKRFAVSKILIKFVKDPAAFQKSLATLFTHDFDNIVLSHGSVVAGGGKAKLREALLERGYSI